MNNNKLLLGALIGIIVFAIIAGAYYLGTQSNNPTEQTNITPTTQPTITQSEQSEILETEITPTETKINQVDIKTLFITSLANKQYDNLLPYIDENVQVRIESSGCCGPLTPAEAVKQLEYFNEVKTWDFNPSEIKTKLSQVSKDYANPYVVGIADNKMGVSFKTNAENKIDAINLMATYELLIP